MSSQTLLAVCKHFVLYNVFSTTVNLRMHGSYLKHKYMKEHDYVSAMPFYACHLSIFCT